MAALAVGDVVRIALVATVTGIDAAGITVTTFGATPVVFPRAINNDPGFTYEPVPTAEPAYVAGELYRDAQGSVFQRTGSAQPGDRWRVLIHPTKTPGQFVGELLPVRPLVHLIPAA
jgi:hypothetical protein